MAQVKFNARLGLSVGSTPTDVLDSSGNLLIVVPVSAGGTGTTTPALVQGTNVTITGSWPNQTINAAGGAETDTLATVTARGATPTVVPTFSNGAVIQGLTVGKGANAVATNTAVGVSALNSGSLSAVYETAIGYNALIASTTGNYNTAVGGTALKLNTSGSGNTAVGVDALSSNISGTSNSAVGVNALAANTGSSNSAVGVNALQNNTGSTNIGIGSGAGSALTTGNNNTIIGSVTGTAGLSDTVIIAAGSAERMRINSSGNVGIGLTPQSAYKMLIGGTLSDATSVALSPGATASSTVSTLFGVRTNLYTAASAFTLSSISHFYADAATVGSGSTITNQYGFNAPSSLTSATNNYGFYGNIASGTGRYNLHMAGTADNYLAGNLGIGTTAPTYKLDINGNSLGTTAGNQVSLARLISASANADSLEVTNTRVSAGTSWTTAGFRLQQKVDSTWMAWQQFNGGADGGIVWGAGTTTSSAIGVTEKMRLDASGRLSIGTVSSDSLLRVAGQIESTVTGYKFPDGTVQATAASGANWTKITTATTATTKKQYVTDTTAGAFTVTLPATPAAGDYVYFMDAGNWATNNLTVARNGTTIEASATDLVLDVKGLMVQLIYDGTTWQVMSNIGPQGPVGPAQGVGKVIAMAMIFGG